MDIPRGSIISSMAWFPIGFIASLVYIGWQSILSKSIILPSLLKAKSVLSTMATPKTSFHARSISLPSTSHPLDVSVEDYLRRLSASQAGPPSSSSICQQLCCLKDLYEQLNDSVHLPHNQQLLPHELLRGEAEELVEGSLALLDISSSAMNALSLMKESILNLQSALRRGSDDEGIRAYLMSRNQVYKMVSKCLGDLKKVEKNSSLVQSENDVVALRMLKEAGVISLSTLKSLLLYLMGKKTTSQTRGWSLVAKLVKSKHASCQIENACEVEQIDSVLLALSKKRLGADTKTLLKQLETLEMTIHELEDGLVSISRRLVKTRVSLLNVLNH